MSREVIIQRIEKSDLIDAKKELMIDLVNSKKEDNFISVGNVSAIVTDSPPESAMEFNDTSNM